MNDDPGHDTAEEILQTEHDDHYADRVDFLQMWKIELTVTEVDENFEYQFNVNTEVSGTETYANYILDKYVKYFEKRGCIVGGGLVKIDEEE